MEPTVFVFSACQCLTTTELVSGTKSFMSPWAADVLFSSGRRKPRQKISVWLLEANVLTVLWMRSICGQMLMNILKYLWTAGSNCSLWILLCRPGALYILCLWGKKGELGRPRIPSEPWTQRTCATAWSRRPPSPPPSLWRLTWERAVLTRTFFFLLKESRQYFVSKSFVKGASYRPKLLTISIRLGDTLL